MCSLCLQDKTIYYRFQNTKTWLILASTKFVDKKIFPNVSFIQHIEVWQSLIYYFTDGKYRQQGFQPSSPLKISQCVKDDVLKS